MKASEIRKKFLDYFVKKTHTQVASSSLIPEGDSTLIFTNAGMFQFKNVFLGLDQRGYNRAASSQKCVRAGGKHNDLDNVGYTARHHTFFEMLGNFSFGDYFKKEAIAYAWDFLTNELKIPKERLYVTVFTDDDEAEEIWHKEQGVDKNRIFRFGEKDNFWRMGDTGPCGPCSEIFYDHNPELGVCKSKEDFEKGGDEDRFIEIWNLVFMQYYEEPKGHLEPLPKPSVDTGMGLERLAALLQGKHNNYESDLFTGYIAKLEEWSGRKQTDSEEYQVAMRVLADHARCISFLIGDGVLPSNDGRGYVLRRIIRRAIRYGRKLSHKSLLSPLCGAVIDQMSDAYPNLQQKRDVILHTVEGEEERFFKTLDQGTQLLEQEIEKAKREKGKELSGEIVFKLYDTYGFPADLTDLIAKEKGLKANMQAFSEEMEKAKEKARKTWKGATIATDKAHLLHLSNTYGSTKFVGYTDTHNESKVIALSDGSKEVDKLSKGETAYLIAEETCFYAESGGQAGDTGSLEGSGFSARVLDCTKVEGTHILQVEVEEGEIKKNSTLRMLVDKSLRRSIMNNHSGTHLLHAALRSVLGPHVTQAGSLVDSERLRFDFTHNQPVSEKEIKQIEALVNKEISLSRKVTSDVMSYDQAMESGAMALFGEKYGDEVRVIRMGDFSTELCGGTHVENTSSIRMMKIVSETGISAGVRRIEALTGERALSYLLKANEGNSILRKELGIKESWTKFLEDDSALEDALNHLNQLKNQLKSAEKEIKKMQVSSIDYHQIFSTAKVYNKAKLVVLKTQVDDRKILSDMVERFKDFSEPAVIVVTGSAENNIPILVGVTQDLTATYKAGDLFKYISSHLGGKGGGRPDLAQGAIEKDGDIEALLSSKLNEV